MNNFLKAVALITLSLGLTNCKVEFTADGDLLQKDGIETSLTKIRYYNGGWYPAPNQANFKADLVLSLLSDGKVALDLQLPECKISKLVPVIEFSKLADALDRAQLFRESGDVHMVDGGDELIQATDESGEMTEIHLRQGDHSNGKWRFTDPSEVRPLVDSLIARYGTCSGSNSKIVAVEFSSAPNDPVPVQAGTNGQDANVAPAPYVRENRSLRVDVVGGKQLISGRESIVQGITRCERQFDKVESHQDLIGLAGKIVFTESNMTCSMSPSNITVITVTYADGRKQYGYMGCWASLRALNSEEFAKDLLKALAPIPAKCSY
jgi:hypothetical protein